MLQLDVRYKLKRMVENIHTRVSDIFTPHLYIVFHYKELEDGLRMVNYRNKEGMLIRRNRTFYSGEVYSLCLLCLIITNHGAIVKFLLVIRSCMHNKEFPWLFGTSREMFDYT